MALEADQLVKELNLDEDDAIQKILNDAENLLLSMLDNSDIEYWEKQPLFERGCYALATAMYYDRTLESGLPKGVQMIVAHLRGADYHDNAKN